VSVPPEIFFLLNLREDSCIEALGTTLMRYLYMAIIRE
jgi:hypothetical protein